MTHEILLFKAPFYGVSIKMFTNDNRALDTISKPLLHKRNKMKQWLVWTAAAALLSGSALQAENTRIGMGVGVSNDTMTVRAPIDLTDTLRLEPEFGVSYYDHDDSDTTMTDLMLGAGLYMTSTASKSIDVYYGGKAYIDYTNIDYDGGDDVSSTNLIMGGVYGFEYHMDPSVTLGAEAGAYIGVGEDTSFRTKGEVLLRYYF
jgi:outer membrane scaffolding protein for murein synthesis (MipA/OmpV family)